MEVILFLLPRIAGTIGAGLIVWCVTSSVALVIITVITMVVAIRITDWATHQLVMRRIRRRTIRVNQGLWKTRGEISALRRRARSQSGYGKSL
jgi:membrane protein YdbS with pleckstrin-like domain